MDVQTAQQFLLLACKHVFVDCSAVPQAKLSCENDTLRVTWSTDVVYDAAVTTIPDDIKRRLGEKFVNANGHKLLTMIIISKQPP